MKLGFENWLCPHDCFEISNLLKIRKTNAFLKHVGGSLVHDYLVCLSVCRSVCLAVCLSVFLSYWCVQGRSQPHSPGWARVPLSSFFPQISSNFSYFSSNFTYFLPHFCPPGWQLPGRPWLRHWMCAWKWHRHVWMCNACIICKHRCTSNKINFSA